MTQQPAGRAGALALSELFTRYLQRQAQAQAEGLGYAEPTDEVVPHEAAPAQPVDPQLAWGDAVAAAQHFAGAPAPKAWPVPPDWPGLVAAQEPAVALAFCLGNYPQLVRNLHPLLSGEPAALRLPPGRPLPADALADWASHSKDYPQALLAAGVLRLARHFDEAADLLHRAGEAPAAWQAVKANEAAALAWHRGRGEEALALWQAQAPSVPVLFNRGMAALFLGRRDEAVAALTEAVAALPDTSAWHHLGHLYLALASRA
jgi:tetratricopeptide (TPR) repeat protein